VLKRKPIFTQSHKERSIISCATPSRCGTTVWEKDNFHAKLQRPQRIFLRQTNILFCLAEIISTKAICGF